MQRHDIDLDTNRMREFRRKWRIKELAVFGSFLRDDFRPDSDIDFLVEFEEDEQWSLFDLFRMTDELERIVGRKVDIAERRAIAEDPNWIRRTEILSTAEAVNAPR
jgi:predicted nucleotidyltransferase